MDWLTAGNQGWSWLVLGTLLGVLGQAPALAGARPPAELVIRSARVLTMDPDRPRVQALAISGGHIVAVGSNRQLAQWIGPATKVVELPGYVVLPGFIDSHGHFLGLGESLLNIELGDADSFAQVVERVARAAARARPGEWLAGRGWHQERWHPRPKDAVAGMPHHRRLSEAAPRNPVYLRHASGHAALVNQAALRAAGLRADTPDPPGGRLLRDEQGKLTGVLLEAALEPVEKAYRKWLQQLPEQQRRRRRQRAVQLAARTCLEQGVTTFCDAGASFAEVDLYLGLARRGRLPLRLWVMLGDGDAAIAANMERYRLAGAGGGRLWVGGIKRYADGALGSHGAWLLEPYADKPTSRGLPASSREELLASARLARRLGLQLCTHAIGDAANRLVLDVYQQALAGAPGDRRWRIEHAQHLHPDDIPRFGRLGVVASMQSYHCISDGPWVEKRLGRARAASGAYAWRSLLAAGARLAWGTDTPVEAERPLAGLQAFVSRRLADGTVFHRHQAIGREQALAAMTRDAAWAARLEDEVGSLAVGRRADLVVLSGDPLQVPVEEISRLQVLVTLVDGRVAWKRDDFSW